MRALIVIIALGLGAAVGLYYAGVFGSAGDDPTPTPNPSDDGAATDGEPSTPESGDGESEDGGLATVDPTPADMPALEKTKFPEESRALVLARRALPENAFTAQVLGAAGVPYQSWYLNAGADAAVGDAKGLAPLTTMPTADFLLDMEVTLLVVDNVDPNDLPDTFWAAVRERVGLGTMGLLVRAYPPYSPTGDPQLMVHALLTHAVTKTFIPIAAADTLAGRVSPSGQTTVPGMFPGGPRPFVLTDAGATHPATRLSHWSRWNRAWWKRLFTGDTALGTKFCYPVTELVDGSKTLIGVTPKEGDDLPAFVVGPSEQGRVLWLGAAELGWDFFHNSESSRQVGVALHNMLAWLAGGEPAALDAE